MRSSGSDIISRFGRLYNKMLFSVLIAIFGLHCAKCQIFVEDFQLSRSQDVSHLRVEYHTSNNALENDSMTYSLWKGIGVSLQIRIKNFDEILRFNFSLHRPARNSCVPIAAKVRTKL